MNRTAAKFFVLMIKAAIVSVLPHVMLKLAIALPVLSEFIDVLLCLFLNIYFRNVK